MLNLLPSLSNLLQPSRANTAYPWPLLAVLSRGCRADECPLFRSNDLVYLNPSSVQHVHCPYDRFHVYKREGHKQPLYCVSFNCIDPSNANLFASVGSNQVSIYRCDPNGKIDLLQVYTDEDKEEHFYVCKWTINEETGAPLLLLAGLTGLVRVLDAHKECLVHTFAGHGKSINDISVHPTRPHLFLTASKDESLRLWNVKTKLCVLVVAGEGGHTNEVLSIDFHRTDVHRFVSAGMDNCVKIWSTQGCEELIQMSMTEWTDTTRSFPVRFLIYPMFSSHQVHGNYVDCVRWVGNCIVSKSVDDKILLWRPKRELDPNASKIERSFTLVQEFRLSDCDIWWIRFSLDFECTILACGNRSGRLFIFDPYATEAAPLLKLQHPRSKSTVRQTAISLDGKIIIACCEDGTIWRWDKTDDS